ncbi:MAG: LysM domain-containing protein [Candidatus Obscuribacterales bacterium]|nr:LysM domain-containing protein [Candidatus Obscuribacterales bacterium]
MSEVGPNPYNSGLDQTTAPPSARVEHDEALARIHQELHDQPHHSRFHGLNLGIIKIGVTDEGSLDFGANIGIAKAEVKLGLENSVHAGVGLGPIVGAEGGVGVGVNKHGFHAGVGAGGHALGLAGVGGEVGAKLGDAVGADGVAGVYVGPQEARAGGRGGAGAALGQAGLDAAVGADIYAGQFAGLNAGGQLSLNRDSQVGVDAGGNIDRYAGRTGVGFFSDGNSQVRADVYADGANGRTTTYGDINPPQPVYDGGPQYGAYDSAARPVAYDGYAPGDARPLPPVAPITEAPLPPPPPVASDAPTPLAPPAPITEAPLPPVKPEHVVVHPTHAQVDAAYHKALKEECDKSSYTVQKGDTYLKIAQKLMPQEQDRIALYVEAAKLQDLHERNGYHSLKPGQRIATREASEVNHDAVMKAADYSASDLSS